MAVPVHDRWLAAHRDNPSGQTLWDTDLASRLFLPPKASPAGQVYDASFLREVDKDAFRVHQAETWCLGGADECLAAQGLKVDDDSRRTVAKAIAAAVQRASLTLARLA
jgi:hypothetical protein